MASHVILHGPRDRGARSIGRQPTYSYLGNYFLTISFHNIGMYHITHLAVHFLSFPSPSYPRRPPHLLPSTYFLFVFCAPSSERDSCRDRDRGSGIERIYGLYRWDVSLIEKKQETAERVELCRGVEFKAPVPWNTGLAMGQERLKRARSYALKSGKFHDLHSDNSPHISHLPRRGGVEDDCYITPKVLPVVSKSKSPESPRIGNLVTPRFVGKPTSHLPFFFLWNAATTQLSMMVYYLQSLPRENSVNLIG